MSDLSIVVCLTRDQIINANDSLTRMHEARLTRELRDMARFHAHNFTVRRKPRFQRARLDVWICWPDRRRRDRANISPTIKALLDGCVDKGVIPDDDDAHLDGPYPHTYDDVTGNGTTRIGLHFKEIDS